ncbi:response regulator [Caldicellulosiruptor morganii]|uniref:response regulator n=1 Tax=Caldicellulosiruptor morganii TaxID=1387555 RepID=UPI0005EAF791|nr:response regulator [Caldicellulosiruptor morganii]
MLKVILIDDEPIILQGLQKIIDWNALGFEIVATAQDGMEGLENIKKFKPEVALVDIRIPGIDGLTLINKLKEEGVNTRVIILSGYSEFEYAKEAIELGVESYLLKPVDPHLLEQKLEKVKQKIGKEIELQKIIKTTQEIGLEKVIEKLLLGTLDNREIDYVNSFYGLLLPWKKYQVAIVKFCEKDSQKIIEEKIFQLKKEVDLFLKRNCCGYLTIINHDICILFKDFWYPFNSKSINMLKESLVRMVGNQVVISIGSEVDDYTLIKESFNEAIRLLEKRFLFGYRGIVYIGECLEDKRCDKVEFDDKEYAEKLAMAIVLNGFDSINKIVEEKSEHFLHANLSEDDIKIGFSNFYIETLYRLSHNELYKPIIEKYLNKDILKSFYIQSTLTELKALIKFYFLSLADEIDKMNPDNLKQKISEFIEKNYFADIRLETISDAFGYNSSYFSKLFKKVFGENFTIYLDRIRVEKAKAFLKEGYKVSETCKKVGFDDVDYFCKKFKKYVGISPREFKEKQKN